MTSPYKFPVFAIRDIYYWVCEGEILYSDFPQNSFDQQKKIHHQNNIIFFQGSTIFKFSMTTNKVHLLKVLERGFVKISQFN